MSIKANKSYLLDEQSRLVERVESVLAFLEENPAKYLSKRVIRGKEYIYLKFRKGGKYSSEYVGKPSLDLEEIKKQVAELMEKRRQAKEQLKKAKLNLDAVKKQLKVLDKAMELANG